MSEPITPELATYVRKQLEIYKVSKRKLAAFLDLSPTTVNKFFGTGEQTITADTVVSIAKRIGADPLHLLMIGGFLRPEPKQTTREREVLTSFRRLSEEGQATAIMLMDFLFQHRGLLPWDWHLENSMPSDMPEE